MEKLENNCIQGCKNLNENNNELSTALHINEILENSSSHTNESQTEVFVNEKLVDDENVLFLKSDEDNHVGQESLTKLFNNYLTETINLLVEVLRDTFLNKYGTEKKKLNGIVDENISNEAVISDDFKIIHHHLSDAVVKLKQLKHYFEKQRIDTELNTERLQYEKIIKDLEERVKNQKIDNEILKENLHRESEHYATNLNIIKSNYETEISSLQKKCEIACNNKDSAVIRYAVNEKQLITLRKEKETLEKKLKELQNENNKEIQKLKSLTAEKINLSEILANKKSELSGVLSSVENLKEELRCKDIKTKWIEEELRNEIKVLKENEDDFKEKIKSLEAEIEDLKCKLKPITSSDSCVEKEGCQIIKSGNDDADPDDCRIEINKSDDPIYYEKKVKKLETDLLNCEENYARMKLITDQQQQRVVELETELANFELLQTCLERNEERLILYETEMDKLKEINNDLQNDIKQCKDREAELLAFTEKLTAKNVTLQTECAALEAKKAQLEDETNPLKIRIVELQQDIVSLNEQFENELSTNKKEIEQLKQQLVEKSEQIKSLTMQLEEKQAENQSLRYKYSSSIKEMSKELQQLRKLQPNGIVLKNASNDNDCVSFESRTSSCNSLNDTQMLNSNFSVLEPDRQALIEKIVKLQRENAKYAEKMEFLEEHTSQMLSELKKKTKILQNYILREQTGTLSSDAMDRNKAEMSKYGGIMSTLYGGRNNINNIKTENDAISLELSLEINQKLQAVLEDTLLKNITLKENMETLGKEIERLANKNS